MLRFSLCVALATLAVPATASAAGFGEPPYMPVSGAAGCVRATGAPGEVVRSTATGAELLTASAAGFANPVEVAAPAPPQDCPAAAGNASGAGVAAFSTRPDETAEVDVALREPGGAWGPASKLASGNEIFAVTSAVSARGDAIVAWVRGNGSLDKPAYHVFAALRPAGGAFAAPVELPGKNVYTPPAVKVGMSDAGEAVAVWTTGLDATVTDPFNTRTIVDADVAPPGGTFHAAAAAAKMLLGSAPALAVAPDGRALLAAYDGKGVEVVEREPGSGFHLIRTVATADPIGGLVTTALGAGGSAAVAWQPLSDLRAQAITRAGTGAFTAPVPLAPALPRLAQDPIATFLRHIFNTAFGLIGILSASDARAGDIRAAITGDGRAVFTFSGEAGAQGAQWDVDRGAILPLGGAAATAQVLGDQLRAPGSLTPLVLAGGAPAAAWSDAPANAVKPRGGRLRLAVEGVATAADPPAPKVTIGKPLKSALRPGEALELPVRCAGPCEVLGSVEGRAATGRAELGAAGATTLEISGGELFAASPAPARAGTVKVRVLSGAPGARTPVAKVVSFKLRSLPLRGAPKVLDVRARRSGKRAIAVTVRTAEKVDPEALFAVGTATRSRAAKPIAFSDDASSSRKTTHVTFKVFPAAGVRYVTVVWTDDLELQRLATVKVG